MSCTRYQDFLYKTLHHTNINSFDPNAHCLGRLSVRLICLTHHSTFLVPWAASHDTKLMKATKELLQIFDSIL